MASQGAVFHPRVLVRLFLAFPMARWTSPRQEQFWRVLIYFGCARITVWLVILAPAGSSTERIGLPGIIKTHC
jgi:hypothetical protein